MRYHRIAAAAVIAAVSVSLSACNDKPGSHSAAARQAAAPHASAVANPPAGASTDDFCKLLKQKFTALSAMMTDPNATDPSAQKLLSDWNQVEAAAPPEIKPDITTIADTVTGIVQHKESSSALDTPQVQSAMQHYATYTAAHCSATS
ncbi:MAG: hypothetical protein WCB04_12490 [Mycobacteriales bacterium]